MNPLAIYARISDDDGRALGVQRQEDDCRSLARLRGLDVGPVYVDNNVSAFKRGVIRPRFEQMLTDLEARRVGGILVYDLDRLARKPADLERLIDIYDEHPSLKFGTVTGDIDLSSPDGRTMARVMVAFANKSSQDTGRRVARKHLELAQRGVPVGGTRPFGWEDDKATLHPAEAAAIRTAVDDLLEGRTDFSKVARRWTEQGFETTKGNPWQRRTARLVLLSPRVAGFRLHQGEVVRDAAGERVVGLWEPIITPDEHDRLIAIYGKPNLGTGRNGRSGQPYRPGGRKYLLSGLARCGECGAKMTGNKQPVGHIYRCPPPTHGGCGKVGISGHKTDEMVSLAVRIYLEKVTTSEASQWPGADALAMKTGQVAELMAEYKAGNLSGSIVFPQVQALEAEIRDLRGEQAAWDREHRQPIERGMGDAWDTLTVEAQRGIVDSAVAAIVIDRAAKKGGAFDAGRIHISWRE